MINVVGGTNVEEVFVVTTMHSDISEERTIDAIYTTVELARRRKEDLLKNPTNNRPAPMVVIERHWLFDGK